MITRQAIVTKYLGPTNSRGSRVKATAAAGSVTIAWESALNSEENHKAAAEALQRKFGWDRFGALVAGQLPDGSYCHVQIPNEYADALKAAGLIESESGE